MNDSLPLEPSSLEIGFHARRVLRQSVCGVVGTTDRVEGYAYTSFCSIGVTLLGEPVFLWSDLADHTQNIMQDDRVSLLCEQTSHRANPQAGPRVTIVGEIVKSDEECLQAAFFQKHPSAKMYAEFTDFNFYKLSVEKAHYVGGFGKAVWVEKEHFLCAKDSAILFERQQDEILSQINTDFPRLSDRLVAGQVGSETETSEVVQVDLDGLDLRYQGRNLRIDFDEPVQNYDQIAQQIEMILKSFYKENC